MNYGGNSVNILSDGTLMVDGGYAFGQVPRTEWETQIKPDRRNRVRFAMNSMVIKTPNANILVDTGAGNKRTDQLKESHHINGNKLIRNLKEVGLNARDIDIVVLTHLHFDHSGGCTKLNRSGDAVPIYPKARHIVQEKCWIEAVSPNERFQSIFHQDDFMPLEEKGLIELVDGDSEIAPGVTLKVADGPSKGHQMVLVDMGSERVVFASDLIPTSHHLQANFIAAADEFPNETLVQKKELIDMAMREGWIIVFGHGQEHRSGYVEEWNGRPHLLPKEV
ncbi:MAG: MBL fold metallo-hydrolase [SAR202 cluster bacterium]|jgi:glyoxylase-like metal-dependent hydrolase (beta-lactamase superfamily II)|nr:MBL fold metallo-hydrolase [SAR202 cluster bacterium]|tara:strand:- start:4791 stop:5627 length:837 start_codon:yes stop_codon:yes gene_type:complete